jgi:hypothetical protein
MSPRRRNYQLARMDEMAYQQQEQARDAAERQRNRDYESWLSSQQRKDFFNKYGRTVGGAVVGATVGGLVAGPWAGLAGAAVGAHFGAVNSKKLHNDGTRKRTQKKRKQKKQKTSKK